MDQLAGPPWIYAACLMGAAPEAHSSALAAMRDHLGDELRFIFRGARTRDRWRIVRILAHNHLRVGRARTLTKRLPGGSSTEFDLELRDGPSLRVRSDDVVLLFIYGVGEYDVDFARLGRVESLLDLGANIGLASIYLSQRLGIERAFCVEAAAANFRLLEQNLARNFPQAHAIHAAAVGEPGAYRVEEDAEPGQIRVVSGEGSVKALTVSEILDLAEMERVDLMKIDIEGGEAEIFEHVGDWGERVGAILGEVHPPLTAERAYEQLAEVGLRPLPLPDHPGFRDIIFARRPSQSSL
jgi:FkbM family methyltransferase